MHIIIGMPPQAIIIGAPIAIMAFIASQRSFIRGIIDGSAGIIRIVIPSFVISQATLHIIGAIPPIIIGIIMPPIIGIMPGMPPIIGIMPGMPPIIGIIPIIGGVIIPGIGAAPPIMGPFIIGPFIIGIAFMASSIDVVSTWGPR